MTGYMPVSPGGTTKFLRADLTWASPSAGSGGSIQYGTRASLPAANTVSAGTLYLCTDSPYSYLSDGSNWQAYIYGYAVVEPSGLTKINSGPTTTLNTTYGGYLFYCASSGDQVVSYVMAVTPSNTLKVTLGFLGAKQCGVVIYNSNNNKVYFFRVIGNGAPSPTTGGSVYKTLYTSDGASVSSPNAQQSAIGYLGWPYAAFYVKFDATNFYVGTTLGPDDSIPALEYQICSEALATNIGTNYTHVGFGVNNSGADQWIWAQHLKIVST